MLDRAPAPPTRGTRPRNRRALILAAASDLFARRGYEQIGMGDIAAAVAIGPSALYRHFSGKQHLLAEVITAGLAPIAELVDRLDLTDRDAALSELSALALDERHLGLLWQREARHLAAEDRARTLSTLRTIGQRLTARIRAARPELDPSAADLLTWCVLSVLTSPSFHRLELPRPDFDQLLAELAGIVLDTPLAPLAAPPREERTPKLVPASRREALLNEAIRMFARHGYAAVGIEDIGAAVGIAGPSIYNHVASKIDMLSTAFQRGSAVLFTDLAATYRTAADAEESLRLLVRSYLRFVLSHHDLIGLLITEIDHLPEDERHAGRRAQHEYVNEWVHLLRTLHPDLDPTTARVRVHAAISIANDAARTPHLRRHPALPAVLEDICTRVLRLS